jgi:hypothetical protein
MVNKPADSVSNQAVTRRTAVCPHCSKLHPLDDASRVLSHHPLEEGLLEAAEQRTQKRKNLADLMRVTALLTAVLGLYFLSTRSPDSVSPKVSGLVSLAFFVLFLCLRPRGSFFACPRCSELRGEIKPKPTGAPSVLKCGVSSGPTSWTYWAESSLPRRSKPGSPRRVPLPPPPSFRPRRINWGSMEHPN